MVMEMELGQGRQGRDRSRTSASRQARGQEVLAVALPRVQRSAQAQQPDLPRGSSQNGNGEGHLAVSYVFVSGVASGDPCHFISLGAACGDSVFCCSGTASADPCDFISFHRIISLGTACGDSVFCSVVEYLLSSGTASGDPFTYCI